MDSFPDSVILDREVIVSELPISAEDPTVATGVNSNGDKFSVRLHLTAPPRPSRLALHWPPGGRPLSSRLSIVAAHRDAVLLQMAYDIPVPGQINIHQFDYFLYRSSGSKTSLVLLPPIGDSIDEARAQIATVGFLFTDEFYSRLDRLGVGVLCRRGEEEEEFVVAELQMSTEKSPCLNVYRPSCSVRWETICLRLRCKDGVDLAGVKRRWNCSNTIVPFGSYLCWVDYSMGILFWNAFEGAADLEYLAFPQIDGRCPEDWLVTHRSVSVTKEVSGEKMKFVCITSEEDAHVTYVDECDDAINSARFTVKIWTLKFTTDDHGNAMFWEIDSVVNSNELFCYNGFDRIPHVPLIFPLIDSDDPSIMYYVFHAPRHMVLAKHFHHEIWLVSVDMTIKVVNSKCRYVALEENPTPEEATFFDAKQHYFESFIPSEFPKFLNLHGTSASRKKAKVADVYA